MELVGKYPSSLAALGRMPCAGSQRSQQDKASVAPQEIPWNTPSLSSSLSPPNKLLDLKSLSWNLLLEELKLGAGGMEKKKMWKEKHPPSHHTNISTFFQTNFLPVTAFRLLHSSASVCFCGAGGQDVALVIKPLQKRTSSRTQPPPFLTFWFWNNYRYPGSCKDTYQEVPCTLRPPSPKDDNLHDCNTTSNQEWTSLVSFYNWQSLFKSYQLHMRSWMCVSVSCVCWGGSSVRFCHAQRNHQHS